MKTSNIIIAISTMLCVTSATADTMEEPVENCKYKINDVVDIKLTGTQYHGVCRPTGKIFKVTNKSKCEYRVKNVICNWSVDNKFALSSNEVTGIHGLNNKKVNCQHKIGEKVMINLKGNQYNGRCNPMGEISGTTSDCVYFIKGIVCRWGVDNSFWATDSSILEVFSDADFKEGGKYYIYSKKGALSNIPLLFKNKTNNLLPCMRNDLDEDKKEELCKKNKFKFY